MYVSYLQSSNMSHDGRLTVVRLLFDCRSKLLKLVTVFALLLTIGVGNMWGAEAAYKTAKFGSAATTCTNANSYSNSWTSTYSGFTVTVNNGNNSNCGWNHVRFGSKSAASTGTIVTGAIDKKVSIVSINLNAVNTTYTTSIKLYTSTNGSTWTERGSFSKSTGTQSVTIPTANRATGLYYKVEIVCSKSSNSVGNGFVQISQVDYKVETFTMSYNANGGTGSLSDANSPYFNGSTVTIKDNSFSRDGYTFDHWDTKSDDSGTDYAPAATFSISANTTLYAQWVADGCSNYSFHYGTDKGSDWSDPADYCFVESTSDGNGGKFWLLEDFTMPAKPDFYVGWQGSFNEGTAKSKTLGFSTIPFDLQRTKTIGTYDGGNTQGAIGILRIRSSYGDDNKYIGFIPGGYVLRLGSGDSWTSYAFTPASANYYETVWTTDIMTLTAGILGGNAYVGLKTASSYVWNSTYSQSNAINGNMGQKSGAGDSWGSNLSSSADVGKRGKFRIWADNANKNWNLHFVPYHHIIFHSNYPGGGGPADTYSVDVSVEETKSDIALPSAPTAPTGYTFAGWYDAASGGTKKTGNQTISAGASADPEYYAHWYGITLVVKDEDGTTLSGDGKPTLTRSGLSLTATTAGKYVFKDIQITSGTGTLSSTSSTTPTITAISSDITVTATFYKPIAVTKGTNTGAATFTLSATEVARGGNVTITCAADASHKGNPTITATSGNYSTISVASATSASVNGITGPVTINISYTAKETATVKLHVAGSTSTISGTRYEGDSYTLPSDAAECPDMGLYGWYTTDYEHATTAPSGANFKLPGASATLVAGDNDFYAVYATVTPDAADTYTKITTTGELVTGDYLIVGTPYSTMYAMKNAYQTSESTMQDESRTVTDNQITNPASTKAEYIWHFTKSNSTITIYSANSSKYFGFSSNHVALMNSSQNLTYEVSDGKWAIYSGSDYLTYSSYFQRGASKVYQTYLFKRDPSVAGPYTTTPSCTTHTLTVEADPVAGGTAEAAKTVLGETKTTTATATPNSHYDFAYWTISGTDAMMSNTSDGKSTDNPVTVTMGTEDATLTAHFTEKEKCTVVFKNNGTQLSSTTYWRGENPVAPTLTDGTSGDACDATSDTHYGWTKKAWSNTIASKSTIDAKTGAETVYTKAATLPAITAGDDGTTITYHAVWAESVGVPSNEYQLVTNISQLSAGDKIVIANAGSSSTYLMSKDTVTESGYQFRRVAQCGTFSISSSKITISTSASSSTDRTNPHVFTVGKSGDYWTFYDPLLSAYMACTSVGGSGSGSGQKNGLGYENVLSDAGKWSVSISDKAVILSQISNETTDRNRLQANGTPFGTTSNFTCTRNTQSDPYIFRNLSTLSNSNFMTTCCDKNITLGTPSITGGGTVTFTLGGNAIAPGDEVETCSGAKDIVATVTPAAGYSCTALSFSGGSVSVDPTPGAGNYPSAPSAQNYTLSFEANTTATLATTATFTAKTASAWEWKYNGEEIPDPLVLYVGINKQLDVTYTPADLLNTQKNYTVTKMDAHVAQGGKAYDHYTMRGAAGVTTETNSTVTFSLNGLSQTVNVTVKPQPRVHFVDIVHGESFADVGPAVESYVATFIQPTPTHSDVSDPGENYNSCERGHLHLLGWIESTWADAHPGATSGEITGAGSSIYYEAGASINVEVQNGKTFYAVWCIVE